MGLSLICLRVNKKTFQGREDKSVSIIMPAELIWNRDSPEEQLGLNSYFLLKISYITCLET